MGTPVPQSFFCPVFEYGLHRFLAQTFVFSDLADRLFTRALINVLLIAHGITCARSFPGHTLNECFATGPTVKSSRSIAQVTSPFHYRQVTEGYGLSHHIFPLLCIGTQNMLLPEVQTIPSSSIGKSLEESYLLENFIEFSGV